MSKSREIRKVIRGRPVGEGAGVHLRRVFGFGETKDFDPFLLLDDFRSDDPRKFLPGFPWHPHRGIETITYMIEGTVEHGDSLGNSGVIGPGEVQWMTAGSGIIHQEMPKGDEGGRMGGFQLWANLPASHKMMDPRYRDLGRDRIPVIRKNGAKIRLICGEIEGIRGPVTDVMTDPGYLDLEVPAGVSLSVHVPGGHTAFAYVIAGRAFFGEEREALSFELEGENYFDMNARPFISDGELALFDDGEKVDIRAGEFPARLLLFYGKPLGESVAWRGPIVMNTREELQEAFEDLQRGTFIRNSG